VASDYFKGWCLEENDMHQLMEQCELYLLGTESLTEFIVLDEGQSILDSFDHRMISVTHIEPPV
jgi:hypothetical protein